MKDLEKSKDGLFVWIFSLSKIKEVENFYWQIGVAQQPGNTEVSSPEF